MKELNLQTKINIDKFISFKIANFLNKIVSNEVKYFVEECINSEYCYNSFEPQSIYEDIDNLIKHKIKIKRIIDYEN